MNSLVRSRLLDLATERQRPSDSEEPVFACSYTAADKFFPKAVAQAQEALSKAGKETGRLDGYTWRCNRHTLASRLVMAGWTSGACRLLADGVLSQWSSATATWRPIISRMRWNGW
jgi:hypothetical protein